MGCLKVEFCIVFASFETGVSPSTVRVRVYLSFSECTLLIISGKYLKYTHPAVGQMVQLQFSFTMLELIV